MRFLADAKLGYKRRELVGVLRGAERTEVRKMTRIVAKKSRGWHDLFVSRHEMFFSSNNGIRRQEFVKSHRPGFAACRFSLQILGGIAFDHSCCDRKARCCILSQAMREA